MSKIYVIGHKSPDLDSVAAAISYANFKNQLENTDKYVPATAGALNRETVYALEKFGIEEPELLASAAGKELILVDHNEFSQAVDGVEEAKIVELLDHHKLDFKYSEPIDVLIRAWGSSNSIIYSLYKTAGIEADKNLAGLMLSAVLVDTVITKSPTCTDKDKEIIEELARLAGIADWHAYGMDLFKVRSSVAELSAAEIIKSDFKDYDFKAGKFGFGQVETVDLDEIKARQAELLEVLGDLKKANNYHTVLLFITDIIKEGSLFLVATDDEAGFAKAMGHELAGGQVFIDGVISRKKQVIPPFTETFDK